MDAESNRQARELLDQIAGRRSTTSSATEPSDGLDDDRAALLAEWMQAVQSQEPTGDCPRPGCDGKLRATPAIVTAGVVWLEAECDTCRYPVASPNGWRQTPAGRRPGPLAEVHRVAFRVSGGDGTEGRVPDWRERAVGGDY
jgi:hypothetical protein